jgi:hypothetical protein
MSTTTPASVAEMVAQRDALDRHIRDAQLSVRQKRTAGLDALQEAVMDCAAFNEIEAKSSERKNVISVTIDGWLTVSLGYPEDRYAECLTVRTRGGIVADFSGELPPARALTGYLNGLIEHDRIAQAADTESEAVR